MYIIFVSVPTLWIQVQFYHYCDSYTLLWKHKYLAFEIGTYSYGKHFISISRFLREQIGNQQVQLSFQNFTPENLSHLQNYNVSFYVMAVLTVAYFKKKGVRKKFV